MPIFRHIALILMLCIFAATCRRRYDAISPRLRCHTPCAFATCAELRCDITLPLTPLLPLIAISPPPRHYSRHYYAATPYELAISAFFAIAVAMPRHITPLRRRHIELPRFRHSQIRQHAAFASHYYAIAITLILHAAAIAHYYRYCFPPLSRYAIFTYIRCQSRHFISMIQPLLDAIFIYFSPLFASLLLEGVSCRHIGHAMPHTPIIE